MQIHVVAPSAFGRSVIGPASSGEERTEKASAAPRAWRCTAITMRLVPPADLRPRAIAGDVSSRCQQLLLMSCIPHFSVLAWAMVQKKRIRMLKSMSNIHQ
jgi:hypothetical protein